MRKTDNVNKSPRQTGEGISDDTAPQFGKMGVKKRGVSLGIVEIIH